MSGDRAIYPSGSSPRFRRAVDQVLVLEGFFSDHAWDPGGKTKYGITEAVARRHGYVVEDLTVPQAVEIYWLDYWQPGDLDALRSALVALEVFDTRVNLGVDRANRIAQDACLRLLDPEAVKTAGWIDGDLGPATRGALNRLSVRYEDALLHTLNVLQGVHYLELRTENPRLYAKAIKGWMAKRISLERGEAA